MPESPASQQGEAAAPPHALTVRRDDSATPPARDSHARNESSELCCIFAGVGIALAVEVWFVSSIELVAPDEAVMGQRFTVVPLAVKENATAPAAEKATSAITNAAVIGAVFILTAGLTLLLVKRGHVKILGAWMQICSLLVYIFLAAFILDLMFTSYQVAYDLVTAGVILWNFGIVGVVAVYHHGAENLRRGYLISCATIVAWFLTKLPPWTTWGLLGVVSIYDTCSVLSSKGIVFNILGAAGGKKKGEGKEKEKGGQQGGGQNPGNPVAPRIYYGYGSGSEMSTCDASTDGEEYDIPGYSEAAVAQAAQAARAAQNSSPPLAPPPRDAESPAQASQPAPPSGSPPAGPEAAPKPASESDPPPHPDQGPEGPDDAVSMDMSTASVRSDAVLSTPPAPAAEPDETYPGGDEEDGALRGLMFMTETHQLGLGDFVFYSLLVGRSVKSSGFLSAVYTAGGILLGLLATMWVVTVKDIALPALPLPLFVGTMFHLLTVSVARPYYDQHLLELTVLV